MPGSACKLQFDERKAVDLYNYQEDTTFKKLD